MNHRKQACLLRVSSHDTTGYFCKTETITTHTGEAQCEHMLTLPINCKDMISNQVSNGRMCLETAVLLNENDKTMLCVSCIIENGHKNHDLSSIEKVNFR